MALAGRRGAKVEFGNANGIGRFQNIVVGVGDHVPVAEGRGGGGEADRYDYVAGAGGHAGRAVGGSDGTTVGCLANHRNGVRQVKTTTQVGDVVAGGEAFEAVRVGEVPDVAGAVAGAVEIKRTVVAGDGEDFVGCRVRDDEGAVVAACVTVAGNFQRVGYAIHADAGFGGTIGEGDAAAVYFVALNDDAVGQIKAAREVVRVCVNGQAFQPVVVGQVPNDAGAGAGAVEVKRTGSAGDAEDGAGDVGDDEGGVLAGEISGHDDVERIGRSVHADRGGSATVRKCDSATQRGTLEAAAVLTGLAVHGDVVGNIEAAVVIGVLTDVGPNGDVAGKAVRVSDVPDEACSGAGALQVEGRAGRHGEDVAAGGGDHPGEIIATRTFHYGRKCVADSISGADDVDVTAFGQAQGAAVGKALGGKHAGCGGKENKQEELNSGKRS